MKKQEFILKAFQAGMFEYRHWVISVFAITQSGEKSNKMPWSVVRTPAGVFFISPDTMELEKIEDAKVNEPVCAMLDPITLPAGSFLNVEKETFTTVGNLLFNCCAIIPAFGKYFPFITGTVNLQDLETRIAILRKKAESENISIPHDVISLVASSIDTNIREIEGAYTKIVAYASLMGSPITIDLAKKILDAMGTSTKNKQITFDDIIQVTSDYFKIKKEEFFTKKRTQNIAYPRQIAMYLCREMADFSYPRIGEFFGGRDHTTVIHAYEKIVKKIKEDPNCEKTITYLVDKLKQ